MSDGKNLYVLKQPLAIELEKVFNGQVYELPFRQWGMKNNHSCISQETLDEHFAPLDVEALRQQIAEMFHIKFQQGTEYQYSGERPDESEYDFADAVLRVCGLTQEESE